MKGPAGESEDNVVRADDEPRQRTESGTDQRKVGPGMASAECIEGQCEASRHVGSKSLTQLDDEGLDCAVSPDHVAEQRILACNDVEPFRGLRLDIVVGGLQEPNEDRDRALVDRDFGLVGRALGDAGEGLRRLVLEGGVVAPQGLDKMSDDSIVDDPLDGRVVVKGQKKNEAMGTPGASGRVVRLGASQQVRPDAALTRLVRAVDDRLERNTGFRMDFVVARASQRKELDERVGVIKDLSSLLPSEPVEDAAQGPRGLDLQERVVRVPQALGERDDRPHVHASRSLVVGVVIRGQVVPPQGRRAQSLQIVDRHSSYPVPSPGSNRTTTPQEGT
jgi:hypothetical protein